MFCNEVCAFRIELGMQNALVWAMAATESSSSNWPMAVFIFASLRCNMMLDVGVVVAGGWKLRVEGVKCQLSRSTCHTSFSARSG